MVRLLKDSDKRIALDYAERNEIETSFLYSNIIEFGIENRSEYRRCGNYFGYFHNGKLKGVIPFYNLGSCTPHYEMDEAVPFFTDLMKENKFNALLGMSRVVKPLYEEIKNIKSIYEYNESMYLVNKNNRPFTVEGVTFKEAKNTSDNMIDFIINAFFDGFDSLRTKEETIKDINQRGTEEIFILAEMRGKIVSQACVQTFTDAINQIGGVYTLKSERGKGYCKAVVSELCRRIIERGKIPTLFVRKNNDPAIKAYFSLGFEYYDDYLFIKCEVK